MTAFTADCDRCAGLCCVVPAFGRGADFPIDKAPGTRCPNLDAGHRCRIHADLAARGFRGCVAFDCLGAGQQLTQVTLGGLADGRDPDLQQGFRVMRALHDLRWHVDFAAQRVSSAKLAAAEVRLAAAAALPLADLLALDLRAEHAAVAPLLRRVSATLRSRTGPLGPDLHRADRFGADLQGADLRRADLSGALLVAADLRGAALDHVDLRGADLRGARVDPGALDTALFLTPMQRASLA